MKLSQLIKEQDEPVLSIDQMSEPQLLNTEMAMLTDNTIGRNPETLLMQLEELEEYLDDRYFATVQMYLR